MHSTTFKICLLSIIATAFMSTPAYAVDGISITGGNGGDAQMAALALQWNWQKRWFTDGDWSLGGYWELDGSYWKGDGPKPEKDVYGIGFTPVFRFERNAVDNMSPYIEGGIGVHQFSTTKIHGNKSMGTTFEFGDHVGLGLRFGDHLQYDIGYRYQHYSNAGLSDDNGGVNFNEVSFKYQF